MRIVLIVFCLVPFLALASCGDNGGARTPSEDVEFLKRNALEDDVTVTPTGLQYKILQEGEGASPDLGDMVLTHYEGKLVDGRIFDSSYGRNEPSEFQLGRVVRGWNEALQLMGIGDIWELYIPSHLGYGMQPQPGSIIYPNATLIFKVELLAINGNDGNPDGENPEK
jgi:FKBP-type peptidyl-prolyl cis-trans isomerase